MPILQNKNMLSLLQTIMLIVSVESSIRRFTGNGKGGCFTNMQEERVPNDISVTVSCGEQEMVHIISLTYIRPPSRGDEVCEGRFAEEECCKFAVDTTVCSRSETHEGIQMLNTQCKEASTCTLSVEAMFMERC